MVLDLDSSWIGYSHGLRIEYGMVLEVWNLYWV
jgi:hypothetical protein